MIRPKQSEYSGQFQVDKTMSSSTSEQSTSFIPSLVPPLKPVASLYPHLRSGPLPDACPKCRGQVAEQQCVQIIVVDEDVPGSRIVQEGDIITCATLHDRLPPKVHRNF